MALLVLSVPLRSVWWWLGMSVGAIVTLLMLVNAVLLPTVTRWSLGRGCCGTAVLRSDEAEERPGAIRRWTAAVLLAAAGLCVGGAAVSYAVVYAREQAVDHSRTQITIAGPKIVAQMLTYDPKTLQDDFARALSLTTDKYRGQLAAQQDAVHKGQPVINEYWVTDSAIESVTPDRATMLLFLQGRRGTPPDERYSTATVRVSFAQQRDHAWRVDDLTVLTKPKPGGGGK